MKGDFKQGKADLDDGYTRIADFLNIAIAELRLNKKYRQILSKIMRESYGSWNRGVKKNEKIVCTSIIEMSESLGLKPEDIGEALGKLSKWKVITLNGGDGVRDAIRIGVNPRTAFWKAPGFNIEKCIRIYKEERNKKLNRYKDVTISFKTTKAITDIIKENKFNFTDKVRDLYEAQWLILLGIDRHKDDLKSRICYFTNTASSVSVYLGMEIGFIANDTILQDGDKKLEDVREWFLKRLEPEPINIQKNRLTQLEKALIKRFDLGTDRYQLPYYQAMFFDWCWLQHIHEIPTEKILKVEETDLSISEVLVGMKILDIAKRPNQNRVAVAHLVKVMARCTPAELCTLQDIKRLQSGETELLTPWAELKDKSLVRTKIQTLHINLDGKFYGIKDIEDEEKQEELEAEKAKILEQKEVEKNLPPSPVEGLLCQNVTVEDLDVEKHDKNVEKHDSWNEPPEPKLRSTQELLKVNSEMMQYIPLKRAISTISSISQNPLQITIIRSTRGKVKVNSPKEGVKRSGQLFSWLTELLALVADSRGGRDSTTRTEKNTLKPYGGTNVRFATGRYEKKLISKSFETVQIGWSSKQVGTSSELLWSGVELLTGLPTLIPEGVEIPFRHNHSPGVRPVYGSFYPPVTKELDTLRPPWDKKKIEEKLALKTSSVVSFEGFPREPNQAGAIDDLELPMPTPRQEEPVEEKPYRGDQVCTPEELEDIEFNRVLARDRLLSLYPNDFIDSKEQSPEELKAWLTTVPTDPILDEDGNEVNDPWIRRRSPQQVITDLIGPFRNDAIGLLPLEQEGYESVPKPRSKEDSDRKIWDPLFGVMQMAYSVSLHDEEDMGLEEGYTEREQIYLAIDSIFSEPYRSEFLGGFVTLTFVDLFLDRYGRISFYDGKSDTLIYKIWASGFKAHFKCLSILIDLYGTDKTYAGYNKLYFDEDHGLINEHGTIDTFCRKLTELLKKNNIPNLASENAFYLLTDPYATADYASYADMESIDLKAPLLKDVLLLDKLIFVESLASRIKLINGKPDFSGFPPGTEKDPVLTKFLLEIVTGEWSYFFRPGVRRSLISRFVTGLTTASHVKSVRKFFKLLRTAGHMELPGEYFINKFPLAFNEAAVIAACEEVEKQIKSQ